MGGVDLSIPELPEIEGIEGRPEFVGGEEEEDLRGENPEVARTGGSINLQPFTEGEVVEGTSVRPTVESVYSAALTTSAHRLHDQMVLLIAQTCLARGAAVFEDPSSIDLLVQHHEREFIIEVKSVTPKNFIKRLRYALGQVLHYDFLRGQSSNAERRKVLAFAAQIPTDSWSIPFLHHLETDLISLDSGALRVFSPSESSIALFG